MSRTMVYYGASFFNEFTLLTYAKQQLMLGKSLLVSLGLPRSATISKICDGQKQQTQDVEMTFNNWLHKF